MRTSRRIVFDWQLVPFVVSAGIGAFIAYNTPFAWIRFALIAFGVVVYLLFANLPDAPDKRSTLKIVLTVLPSIIAVWFVLTNDWSRDTGKLSILDPVLNVLAALRIASGVPQINPNVIGGAIAALLPLQAATLRGRNNVARLILIGLSLIGLVLSETRGAWLSLVIVTAMWALWKLANRRIANQRKARIVWITIVLIGGVIGLALIVVTPIGLRLIDASGDRSNLWRNSLDLVSDYPLTGFGLGDFEMTYSTYSLLLHVGHTMHAHDLWLNVWLEQGLLGLVALAGLMLNAIRPKPSSPWRMAALAALAVMLLHSLADDPFYGYGGIAIPLVFIPLGLLARPNVEGLSSSSRFQPAFIVWGLAAIGLIVGLILPGGRAILEANLGTVAQTRAELSVYHWPDTPIQDALRRSGGVDLTMAIAHYRAALALDPANASANRRLGQIELSQGEYDNARQHLQAAYDSAPQQRATRQLLGECYALNDSADRAVELWRTIDLGQSQLDIRQWWYGEYLALPDLAAKLKQAAGRLSSN